MRSDPFFVACCAVFAFVALATGARNLIDYDSTQFALALEQQDLRFHQPQPPGFILFVWLARFVKAFLGDAYLSLRIVAVALLIAAAWFIRGLAFAAYDRATARLAVVLFLSSPLVLFHGMTTMIYPAEAFIAATVGYFAWRALRGTGRDLMLLAYLVGILAGVRQTALLFPIPLLLLTAKRGNFGAAVLGRSALAWVLGVLCWLLPQAQVSGGLDGYVQSNLLLQSHLYAISPFREGFLPLEDHLRRGMNVLLIGPGVLRLLYLAARWRRRPRSSAMARESARESASVTGLPASFYGAWLMAPFLLFVVYHFPKSGYALALWPALCLWLAHQLRSRGARLVSPAMRPTAFGLVVALDLVVFFVVPTSHIGREPWDLPHFVVEDARRGFAPRWWNDLDSAPRALQRPVRLFFGRVDFFYDRTRGFKFGGFLDVLRAAGFPRDDTLLLGQDATRVVCFGLPDQALVHADAVRPESFLFYRNRRASRVQDAFEIPATTRWLLIEGPADSVRFAQRELPRSRRALDGPLAGHFELLEIGDVDIDAIYRPRAIAGRPPAQLRLVREATAAGSGERSEAPR